APGPRRLPVRPPDAGRAPAAAEPEVAELPARRAAALGGRDGRAAGPRRPGRPRRGPRPRRHRLPVGAGLRRGLRRRGGRRLGLAPGPGGDLAGRRRDDRRRRGPRPGHRAGGRRGDRAAGLPALRRLRPARRPPARRGAAGRRRPAGLGGARPSLRRRHRGRPPGGPAARQPAQPHRHRAHRRRARRRRGAGRAARCAGGRRRDPRAADLSRRTILHPLPRRPGRRAGLRRVLGLQGLEPGRPQGGAGRRRARCGGGPGADARGGRARRQLAGGARAHRRPAGGPGVAGRAPRRPRRPAPAAGTTARRAPACRAAPDPGRHVPGLAGLPSAGAARRAGRLLPGARPCGARRRARLRHRRGRARPAELRHLDGGAHRGRPADGRRRRRPPGAAGAHRALDGPCRGRPDRRRGGRARV
ncbi:MAG: Cystathionine beta-lyase, type II, partial [uncultured Friedmanniella sp.]